MAELPIVNVTVGQCEGGLAELLRAETKELSTRGRSVDWIKLPIPSARAQAVCDTMHMLGYNAAPEPPGCTGIDWIRASLASAADDLPLPVQPCLGQRIVLLHDAQALGLAPKFALQGHRVVWRHHLGSNPCGNWSKIFWASIKPLLETSVSLTICHQLSFVPNWLKGNAVSVTPGIDIRTAKNGELSENFSWEQIPQVFSDVVTVESMDARPIDPTSKVVLAMSRWAPLKDPVAALELCAATFESERLAHLVLVGPEPTDPSARIVLASVKCARDSLNSHVRSRVHIWIVRALGNTRSDTFSNHVLSLADVFIAMSRAEGFGLVVTEALYHRTPVLGRDVGGIRLQVGQSKGGHTGRSHIDLIDPLIELLADGHKRKALADRGRAAVKQYYSIERSASALLRALSNLEQ